MLQNATSRACLIFLSIISLYCEDVAEKKYTLRNATIPGSIAASHEMQKPGKGNMAQTLSIQKKITYSFSALLALITVTAVIFYILVQQVEEKLYLVEVVDDFLNLTLELRRYEKNYFLYQLDEDFEDNLIYLMELEETVAKNDHIFLPLNNDLAVQQVDTILKLYEQQMRLLHSLNQDFGPNKRKKERGALQTEIRNMGQQLTLYAEEITAREKTLIQRILKTSRTFLLSSTGAAVMLSFLLIMLIRQKIVSSLRLLENYTRKVAQGEIVDPPEKNVEEEIHTLFQAFARMTNELRLRQRQMVQSEKLASLGTLLAGVAHELNNPLSNISTSAQILCEEIESPDKEFKQTMVTQIEEQTDKARDIVKTLLEFSRTKEFNKEELNLIVLVNSALRLLRSEIPSEIEILEDIPENLIVYVDKQRMQQVFLNLIKNAVDACGTRGKIWISAKEYQSGSRREVEILISDNGPGIPVESLQKIFDPFFTSKDVGKGSGLGLFIVHDIIESHGGTISVDSRVDEGTTFIIWLPGETETNDQ